MTMTNHEKPNTEGGYIISPLNEKHPPIEDFIRLTSYAHEEVLKRLLEEHGASSVDELEKRGLMPSEEEHNQLITDLAISLIHPSNVEYIAYYRDRFGKP